MDHLQVTGSAAQGASDGKIGFYRVERIDSASKRVTLRSIANPLLVAGKNGPTGPTGASPSNAKLIPNGEDIRNYSVDASTG